MNKLSLLLHLPDLVTCKRKVLLLIVKNIAIGWSCSGWDLAVLLMGDGYLS